MYKDLQYISTLNMGREEWLEERRKRIGGSDAAGLLGLNPYMSPLSIYMDKKGLTPERGDNLAMWLGREMEELVAKRFEIETGKKARRKNAIVINPRYPFAHANVDRVIVGENAGLECKTTSELNMRRYKNGEYPANYYVQCQHYNAICGFDRMYLKIIVGNCEEKLFAIERDEEEIAALMEQEKAFYENYLLPGVMPEPTGSAQDGAALGTLYAEEDDSAEAVDLTDMRDCFEAYIAANAQKALCERIIDKAKQDIEVRLGNASTGFCGTHKVTWKETVRNDIDKDALKAMGVQIPYKQKTTRTFRFTAGK